MVLMVTVINYYGKYFRSVPLLINHNHNDKCTITYHCDYCGTHFLLICLLLSSKNPWMETWKPCLGFSEAMVEDAKQLLTMMVHLLISGLDRAPGAISMFRDVWTTSVSLWLCQNSY